MDDTENTTPGDIQWHPVFVVALQALLIDYKDDLIKEIFSKEENRMLTAEFCEVIEEIGLGEKWRQEGILKAARAMFAEGDSLEKIARVTGIQLETLKEKLVAQ